MNNLTGSLKTRQARKILVLGGYGNFGKRIVEVLAQEEGITLYVAGRSLEKARALVDSLGKSSDMVKLDARVKARLQPFKTDINDPGFPEQIKSLAPFAVVHTSGPFQDQEPKVAEVCAQAGAHYVDLADDSQFVQGVSALKELASRHRVSLVSGASSVPGLSSAVIDHYQNNFDRIDALDMAIAPGNKAERGEATIRGILSYTGQGFPVFHGGQWQQAYGWMAPRKLDFGDVVGRRWLANVDVPDLKLFPERYQVADTVRFQAGLELPVLHLTLVAMAGLSRIKLVKNWAPLTKPIARMSQWFSGFGTAHGAMRVTIIGISKEGGQQECQWTLIAPDGIGPFIPTLSAIILVKKWLRMAGAGESIIPYSGPCLDQFSYTDFLPYFKQFNIGYNVEFKAA